MPRLRATAVSSACVLLPRAVLNVMLQERLARLPNETGGFLLGHRRRGHIEIVEATLQAKMDRASETSFERIDLNHRHRAEAVWESSGGRIGLVGDWHTHPFGPPRPSAADRNAWRQLVSSIQENGVGIILAEGEPGVFVAPLRWSLLGAKRCSLVEECDADLVFECAGCRSGLADRRQRKVGRHLLHVGHER